MRKLQARETDGERVFLALLLGGRKGRNVNVRSGYLLREWRARRARANAGTIVPRPAPRCEAQFPRGRLRGRCDIGRVGRLATRCTGDSRDSRRVGGWIRRLCGTESQAR